MSWKIEIKEKFNHYDAVGEGIKKDIFDLGIKSLQQVSFLQVYNIEGSVTEEEVKKICNELLVDRVYQEYAINPVLQKSSVSQGEFIVEVAHNPGVMDPVEESTLKGIKDLGINTVTSINTAKKYIIRGRISDLQLRVICEKLLYNKLIQHIVKPQALRLDKVSSPKELDYKFSFNNVELLNVNDKKLLEISSKRQLFLNLEEMRVIKDYFVKLGRNPSDCELETIAQTWSEHCVHKTFRGKIDYKEKIRESKSKVKSPKIGNIKIDNLLKSTIMKVTAELNKSWCVSVFHDNSGIIKFDEKNNVCFKVETHNHPSALEPFGGANTGVGGVIRDPMGTGLGAKPILNTDVFCFANPDYPFEELPKGTLHPKRIMKGVVAGVRDYGNKMGIPTVNGAVLFHRNFVGNPLVYCGTVGVLPADKSFKKTSTGELIVVVGGKTGRDGIHGATFSSGELTHESEVVSSGAVQIGDPIQEKKMLDALLQARDLGLYNSITDCGAGGLSSAVGEMGSITGARVDLDKVPLKYKGLSYTEIWISESQERMVLSVAKNKISKLLEVFNAENVEATVIGEFTNTKKLELFYENNKVCTLDMHFLHEGVPKTEKKAVFASPKHKDPKIKPNVDLKKSLLGLLSHYDICSKEWIVRQYDHEVQGGSVVKPLVGIVNDGPSDAAVVKPFLGSNKAVIVSNGINFRFGFIDPYWMAASCIDEALRQIISVGGSLNQVAILDNFCWGNPDKPDRLGGLVRTSYGCYDIAKAFGVPFISGKDSLYNEFTVKNKSISIPGTILISAISIMEDARKAVTMYAKNPDDLVYIVGMTYDELGASHYYDLHNAIGNNVPKVVPLKAKKIFETLNKISEMGIIQAMHDCSDGGLAVACAEMAFAGGLGMDLFLNEVPFTNSGSATPKKVRNDFVLFSESNSRIIVSISKNHQKEFESLLKGIPYGLIGCFAANKEFKVFGTDKKLCIKATLHELKDAWKKPLDW